VEPFEWLWKTWGTVCVGTDFRTAGKNPRKPVALKAKGVAPGEFGFDSARRIQGGRSGDDGQ
jgi:hypothetical protein